MSKKELSVDRYGRVTFGKALVCGAFKHYFKQGKYVVARLSKNKKSIICTFVPRKIQGASKLESVNGKNAYRLLIRKFLVEVGFFAIYVVGTTVDCREDKRSGGICILLT